MQSTDWEEDIVHPNTASISHPGTVVGDWRSDLNIFQAFYMIFYGHITVLVKGSQVATLGAGETFGELGLDNKTTRTATVKASRPNFICVFIRDMRVADLV